MDHSRIKPRELQAFDLKDIVMGLTPQAYPELARRTTMLMLPGDIQTYRVGQQWIGLAEHVLVAGQRERPGLSEADVRQRIRGTVDPGSIPQNFYPSTVRCTEFAHHTGEQMEWAVQQIVKLGPEQCQRLIVSTAAYHVARCALTFMKHWLNSEPDWFPKVTVLPTLDRANPLDSFKTRSDGTNDGAWGEVVRIQTYEDDVASAEDFERYYRAAGMDQ